MFDSLWAPWWFHKAQPETACFQNSTHTRNWGYSMLLVLSKLLVYAGAMLVEQRTDVDIVDQECLASRGVRDFQTLRGAMHIILRWEHGLQKLFLCWLEVRCYGRCITLQLPQSAPHLKLYYLPEHLALYGLCYSSNYLPGLCYG